jgi:MFS family permease
MQALLWVVTALPYILLGPWAGALVDRWDRRRTVIAADAVSGVVILAAVWVLRGGSVAPGVVYGVVLVVTCCKTFLGPALGALVPRVVSGTELARANGALEFLQGVSQIAGPVVAGVLLAAGWAPAAVLVLDALSYGVAALLLGLVRLPGTAAAGAGAGGGATGSFARSRLRADLAEGLRCLGGRPALLWLLGLFALVNLLGSGLNVLLPQLATGKFHGGPGLMGALEAAMGAGVLAGSGLLLLWGGPKRRAVGVLGALAGASVCQAAAGLATHPWMTVGALGAAVAGWLVASTLQTTLFQEAVEPGMLGRVFGLKRSLEQVTWPVSAVLTGLITPAVMGAGPFLAWSGALSLGAVVLAAGASPVLRGAVAGRAASTIDTAR